MDCFLRPNIETDIILSLFTHPFMYAYIFCVFPSFRHSCLPSFIPSFLPSFIHSCIIFQSFGQKKSNACIQSLNVFKKEVAKQHCLKQSALFYFDKGEVVTRLHSFIGLQAKLGVHEMEQQQWALDYWKKCVRALDEQMGWSQCGVAICVAGCLGPGSPWLVEAALQVGKFIQQWS